MFVYSILFNTAKQISCLTNNIVYFQKLLMWMNVHDHWEDNIGEAATKQ